MTPDKAALPAGADARRAGRIPAPDRVTWAETRAALARDRAHWRRRLGPGGGPPWLHRGYRAVSLYRTSRYAHERGWRAAAWLLWILNIWLSGADLPPSSRIAGGLFLPHPHGAVIAGAVGRDASFGFQARIGGLYKAPERDVGGGPGLPCLGDDVVLEAAVLVLGPVRVGDGARIGPGCLVLQDAAAGTETELRQEVAQEIAPEEIAPDRAVAGGSARRRAQA